MPNSDEKPGYDALWCWFGLSYASFLTLPRVLMHAMPDDWQARMAALLHEYDAAFPNLPTAKTIVTVTQGGKFTKAPPWLTNYRHPHQADIDAFRGQSKE